MADSRYCPGSINRKIENTPSESHWHSLELHRQKTDLEILLETTTEHYDIVTVELERKAKEAVRESERRLAQFLEAVPVGVALIDANGKPYYVNRAAKQILGKGVVPDTTLERLSEVYQTYIAGTNRLYPVEELTIVRALRGESSSAEDIELHFRKFPLGSGTV